MFSYSLVSEEMEEAQDSVRAAALKLEETYVKRAEGLMKTWVTNIVNVHIYEDTEAKSGKVNLFSNNTLSLGCSFHDRDFIISHNRSS